MVYSSSWNTCYQIHQLIKILYYRILNTCYVQNKKKKNNASQFCISYKFMVLFLFPE